MNSDCNRCYIFFNISLTVFIDEILWVGIRFTEFKLYHD